MPKQSTSIKNIYGSETHRLVYTEIAYLKKRIHLVEGERKANYESNEEQLKLNEGIIQGIRQKNTQLKKENREIINLRDNYYEAILTRPRESEQITIFRGKNFEETVDILECRMGDLKNKINLLNFDKKLTSADKKLIKKTEKEVRITLAEKPQNRHTRTEKLKEIENAISTMQLRITEAENVRSRYKYMIETLAAENFTRNVEMTEMESKVQKQKKEKATTKAILFDAVKARKASRIKLIEVEDQTMKDYGLREQKLFQCRANLKEIRNRMEQIGTKLTYPKFHMIHRDSSLMEGLYFGVTGPSESHEIKAQNIIEKVYKGLKDMTGESDPARIISRFQQQREHSKELVIKEKEVRSQARNIRLRKRFLQDKLKNLQFCGGIQWEDIDAHHGKIYKEIEKILKQDYESKAMITDYASTIEQGVIKLNEICIQNGLRASISLTGTRITSERVIEILKVLIGTLEHVLEEQEIYLGRTDLNRLSASEDELSDTSGLSITPFSAFKFGSSADLNLLTSGSAGKVSNVGDTSEIDGGFILKEKKRETMIKSKSRDKRSDSSDDEEAVSRLVIKRKSQVLVESKTRKGRFNPGIPLSPRPR